MSSAIPSLDERVDRVLGVGRRRSHRWPRLARPRTASARTAVARASGSSAAAPPGSAAAGAGAGGAAAAGRPGFRPPARCSAPSPLAGQVAAVGDGERARRSRTARIRRAGSEDPILPRGQSPLLAVPPLAPPWPALPGACRAARTSEGSVGTSGFSIWPSRLVSRCHWSGFSSALNCWSNGPAERVVADVDVVVVVGEREARCARQVLERDHLVGVHRALQLQHGADQLVGRACPGPGGR